MRALSGKAFCRLLERHGWQLLRVQGSHHVYGKAGQRARISVPVHGNRPLKLGLQRHLLKLAGIDEDEVRRWSRATFRRGKTALRMLDIGLRPYTSWGVLLVEAQNINVVALYPWLMLPVVPVILIALAFNFLGDGLRDAADPYT